MFIHFDAVLALVLALLEDAFKMSDYALRFCAAQPEARRSIAQKWAAKAQRAATAALWVAEGASGRDLLHILQGLLQDGWEPEEFTGDIPVKDVEGFRVLDINGYARKRARAIADRLIDISFELICIAAGELE